SHRRLAGRTDRELLARRSEAGGGLTVRLGMPGDGVDGAAGAAPGSRSVHPARRPARAGALPALRRPRGEGMTVGTLKQGQRSFEIRVRFEPGLGAALYASLTTGEVATVTVARSLGRGKTLRRYHGHPLVPHAPTVPASPGG